MCNAAYNLKAVFSSPAFLNFGCPFAVNACTHSNMSLKGPLPPCLHPWYIFCVGQNELFWDVQGQCNILKLNLFTPHVRPFQQLGKLTSSGVPPLHFSPLQPTILLTICRDLECMLYPKVPHAGQAETGSSHLYTSDSYPFLCTYSLFF